MGVDTADRHRHVELHHIARFPGAIQVHVAVFSPDESRVYIADTGKVGKIRAFNVLGDQIASKPAFEIDLRCDGMCTDTRGNIYTTSQGGIHVYNSNGNKYQWRGFYLGILLVIATIIMTPLTNEVVKPYLKMLTTLGSGMVLLSILSVAPLSIWGFVKGFRESRKGE